MNKQTVYIFFVAVLSVGSAFAGDETFEAQDTLNLGKEPSADARKMLEGITWEPGAFTVVRKPGDGVYDGLITFPSPRPSGDALNDRVVMEWYAAMDDQEEIVDGPAMVLVHILDGRMTVARTIARSFAFEGIHSFVIHLPYYGKRREAGTSKDVLKLSLLLRQGAADVRRAHDAVAALPHVNKDRIGVQGTSLGGFVTTMAGSIDGAYDPVLILLAGADLHGMLINGQRDSKNVRDQLAIAGITGDKLREMMWQVEPSRIAHRLNPKRTWLFSAKEDTVVPAANASKLGLVAKLDKQHHQWLNGDHYTVAMYLPLIIRQMTDVILNRNKVP
jgi:dienelactone hydrolase